jgi:hypothetical protein
MKRATDKTIWYSDGKEIVVLWANKNWRVAAAVWHRPKRWRICVQSPWGTVDWPIRYADGQIAYDNPESIPKYVKHETAMAFRMLPEVNKTYPMA